MTERKIPGPLYEGESNTFNGQEVFSHMSVKSFATALEREEPERMFLFREHHPIFIDGIEDDSRMRTDQTHSFVGREAVHKFVGSYDWFDFVVKANAQIKAARPNVTIVEGAVIVDQVAGDVYQIFEPNWTNKDKRVDDQLGPLRSAIETGGPGSLEYFEREARTIVDLNQGGKHSVVVVSGNNQDVVSAIQDVRIDFGVPARKNNLNRFNRELPLSKQEFAT